MTAVKTTRKRLPKKLPANGKKYNLGAGEVHLEGWVNVDLIRSDENIDLGSFPWPIDDACADEIMASHILEHFTKENARRFLAECYRILGKGGKLYIAVPDMDRFIEAKLTGNPGMLGGYDWQDLNHFMGGDEREARPEMRHRYMYNFETLAYMLSDVGFSKVQQRKPLKDDNERYHAISLYVTAVK